MTRVKKGLTKSRRHKKVLSANKGYRGAKNRLIKSAREASLHAGEYAYSGRKQRKRQKRRLWITKLSNVLKSQNSSYSQFINALEKSNIKVDRKILAELATNEPKIFQQIVKKTT